MLPALIFGELCFFLESQGCCGGCQVDSIDAQEAGKESFFFLRWDTSPHTP